MNPLKPNPATPFAPMGMVPAPNPEDQLVIADDSVPESPVPEAGYAKGKRTVDMYGQPTDKPGDPYIAITSGDPNGRENPNAGALGYTHNPLYCATCSMYVQSKDIANPATAHLAHDLSYKGKNNFDVNGASGGVGISGGSYYLSPSKDKTLGNDYRWQADVDRSTGKGNNAKRPVLPGGAPAIKGSTPYQGNVAGRLESRPDDTDPPYSGGAYTRPGPTSDSILEDGPAAPETVADQIVDRTLDQQ